MPENQKTKVAYVVVGWNNLKLLPQCFDSIKSQSYPNKMIIYVDNNSHDGSVDWVKKTHPEIVILAQKKNTGFAKGNNAGVAEALSDPAVGFVAFVNTDATLEKSWTKKIVEFAAHKPRGACYQGTTLDFYNHAIIDSTHIYLSLLGQGTQGSWRFYLLTEMGPKKVFGVNAAAAIISRAFIEAQPFGAKLFDEALYMYLEDVDLAARATVMSWDNYLVPGARAYHMGSVSSKSRSSSFSLYMTFRNNSAVLFKNLTILQLIRIFPSTIKGDFYTIRTLWQRNQKSKIIQVVRGRIVGLIWLPLFARKRRSVSRLRTIDSDYLWVLMREGL